MNRLHGAGGLHAGWSGGWQWSRDEMPRLRLEIVKRSDDIKGFVVFPRRWVVERTFSWLERNRRLAKDLENLAETLATYARRLAIAAGMIAVASLITLKPAQAIDAGTAVGIGLGSFALGSALGSMANPYYNPPLLPIRVLLPGAGLLSVGTLLSAAQLLGPVLPALLRVLSGACRRG